VATADRQRWLDLNRRGMEAAFGSFVRSAGGEAIEVEGVFAGVNPAIPERSVFNSVVYSDPEALAAERERIAAAFAEHGCAWTVWVPAGDTGTARMLEGAGHRLDGEPRAMGMRLDGFAEPELGGIDWTDEGAFETACSLNDGAYGYAPGTWRRGTGRDPQGLITYIARIDGEPAATVAAHDAGGDCAIWNVATAPAARGRGLSTALMRRALADAARRGCETSTLQATKLGRPVYERVGYEDFGALQMWEFRPAELAGDAHPAPAA
jgi:GNAT superfamily N-acetyltransferase